MYRIKLRRLPLGSFLLFLTLSVLLSACASVFGFKRQSLVFHTPSESAKVKLVNKEIGPGLVIKSRIEKDGVRRVVLKNEGHKDLHYILKPHHRSPGFWIAQIPNLASFGMANAYDFYNDKNVRYKRHQHLELEVYPLPYRNEKLEKSVVLDTISINYDSTYENFLMANLDYSFRTNSLNKRMKHSEEYARQHVQTKKKYRRHSSANSIYNISNFKERVLEDMRAFLDTIGHGVLKSEGDMLHIDCQLSSSVRFQYELKNENAFQKIRLVCKWDIKNKEGKRIKSIETMAWSGEFLVNEPEMISDAIATNFLELMNDSEFQMLLAK